MCQTNDPIQDLRASVINLQRRVGELESQLCGAKKKRIDELENRILFIHGVNNGLEERLKILLDKVEDMDEEIDRRVKAIEEKLPTKEDMQRMYDEGFHDGLKDSKREEEFPPVNMDCGECPTEANCPVCEPKREESMCVSCIKKCKSVVFVNGCTNYEPKREPWKPNHG